MTKTRAAKAATPAAPPQQPPAPPTGDDTTVNPVHDEAGAPPYSIVPDTDPLGIQRAADKIDAAVLAELSAGATPPPDDPVPPEPRLPPVLASFHRLDQVRNLPEVVGDIYTQPVEFAEGSIQRFKASETDRRTMEVIALPGQGFAARAVAPEEA